MAMMGIEQKITARGNHWYAFQYDGERRHEYRFAGAGLDEQFANVEKMSGLFQGGEEFVYQAMTECLGLPDVLANRAAAVLLYQCDSLSYEGEVIVAEDMTVPALIEIIDDVGRALAVACGLV